MSLKYIKNTISALRSQLEGYSDLSYASDSGYEDRDVFDLVQLNKFPFFNISAEGWRTGTPPGMNINSMERLTINILIEFATRAIKLEVAMQGDATRAGLYEFSEDIWNAIKSDKTLGGVINGYLPGSTIEIDKVEVEGPEERHFIAGAEMRIQFYKDIGL